MTNVINRRKLNMFHYLKSALKTIRRAFSGCANIARFPFIVFFSLLRPTANLAAPYLLSLGITKFIVSHETRADAIFKDEFLYLAGFGAAWTISRVSNSMNVLLLAKPTADLGSLLTTDILEKYYEKPMASRVENSTSAEVTHFSNILENIAENLLKIPMAEVFPLLLEILGSSLIITTFQDQIAGGIIIGTALLYALSIILFSIPISKAQNNTNDKARDVYKNFTNRLAQYESAHYNSAVPFEIQQMRTGFNPLLSAHVKSESYKEVFDILQTCFIGIAFTSIIFFSVHRLDNAEIDSETAIWIILYLSQFAFSLHNLSLAINKVRQSYSKYKELYDYLNNEHEFSNDHTKPNLITNNILPSIEFEGVNLLYAGEKTNSLSDISFKIKQGETVAIVGETASGKSSLFNLMLGFYHPTTGVIKLYDTSITTVNRESLRKNFAVIPQSPFLFNGTINENISYANPDATPEMIQEAIQMACLQSTVAKHSADKPIGEEGKGLSGGQRQRLSIARAFIKFSAEKTPIVLVDEPTSALDTETGNIIMGQIYNLCRNRAPMSLVITHHLHHVNAHCVDKVLVLKAGRIVQYDTVEALLKNDQGLFATMVRRARISPNELLQKPYWMDMKYAQADLPNFDSSDNQRSRLKDELFVKSMLNKFIPKKYYIAAAYGKGDCFFDSSAQALNELRNTQEFDIKSLRMLCHHHIQHVTKNKNNWIYVALHRDEKLYASHLKNVQYTADEVGIHDAHNNDYQIIWGEQEIEGRILAQELKVKIHVIELQPKDDSPEPILIPIHILISGEKCESVESNRIDYEDKNTIHLVVYRDHFVPILSKDKRRASQQLLSANGSMTESNISSSLIKNSALFKGSHSNPLIPISETAESVSINIESDALLPKAKESKCIIC